MLFFSALDSSKLVGRVEARLVWRVLKTLVDPCWQDVGELSAIANEENGQPETVTRVCSPLQLVPAVLCDHHRQGRLHSSSYRLSRPHLRLIEGRGA